MNIVTLCNYLWGTLMSINFVLFWAIPIASMGASWKFIFKPYLFPIYDMIDKSSIIRKFASDYIYTKPAGADFFATSLLLILNSVISLSTVFYWQLKYHSLPWYLIAAYYCSWVGVGGRIMGAAYALAHKEGHNNGLYQKWIKSYIGNFFENWLGLFFGNVPYNFTTSHVFIHHRLDGGLGDTFYEWDIDRTSLSDFMLYVTRIFLHMVGYSSVLFFDAQGMKSKSDLLKTGIYKYFATGCLILVITKSPAFVFWIYLQPLFCMSYFLALLNIGFHGFIEFDEEGKNIPYVNSTTIIDGDDDYFGEDDHMAHHYNPSVNYKDLAEHQLSKVENFKKYKASVFQKLSILELSIFLLFGLWDKLAEHYVDYTGTMTKEEIAEMLKTRAKRKETNYDTYQDYLSNPTLEARKALVPQYDVLIK